MTDTRGLLERLDEGPVICAEGYLFELERRGYLQAGAFVPEVVLAHPEKVTELHREFVHAGSDVVEAFTYYAHREKLRIIGKEHLLEEINRQALALARDVARETGTMLAGNVCNTNVWTGEDARDGVRAMFEEQVGWAVDAGVDFIIGETFSWTGEALAATEVIKATGLPAVITLTPHSDPDTRDGLTVVEACKAIEAAGADVVGLNCARGPATMLPLLEEVRAAVAIHVAALPVPYRTHATEPSMQSLRDPLADGPDHRAFPTGLDPFTCTRGEVARFSAEALALGIHYLGLCCGAAPHHVRAMAEALGRSPEASHYSADMSKHAYLGTDASLKPEYQAYVQRL
jgi:betaine-homocysteine S-methyltransferase